MKTAGIGILVVGMIAIAVNAEDILFRTSTNYVTTGKVIEGTALASLTTNVQEVAGLSISVRTDNQEHELNAVSDSFGINDKETTNEIEADRFDAGEKMILSFSENVVITNLDFRYLGNGESFTISVPGSAPMTIFYDNLDNKTLGLIATNININADVDVEWYVPEGSQVGLESIGLFVIKDTHEVYLNLGTSNNMAVLEVDFSGIVNTNYVLQSSTNLTTNVWNTVGGTFSSDTNWQFDIDKESQFFRIIEQ